MIDSIFTTDIKKIETDVFDFLIVNNTLHIVEVSTALKKFLNLSGDEIFEKKFEMVNDAAGIVDFAYLKEMADQMIELKVADQPDLKIKFSIKYTVDNDTLLLIPCDLLKDIVRSKEQAVTNLISRFSHDFKNPMSAIFSSLELLQRHEERLSKIVYNNNRVQFSVIFTEFAKLSLMLKNISAILSTDPVKVKYIDTDLVKCIKDGLQSSFHNVNLESNFVLEVIGSPINIFIDPKLFLQIFINLLFESIHLIDSSKQIKLRICFSSNKIFLIIKGFGRKKHTQLLQQKEKFLNGQLCTDDVLNFDIGMLVIKNALAKIGAAIAFVNSETEEVDCEITLKI